jgi:transcriptional regulator with XRE-family HTH domain
MDQDMVWGKARLTADLGRLVRDARRSRSYRQAELAERSGVSRMTISRLERGGDVGVATVVRVLSECGYSLYVVPKFARVTVREPAHGPA